MAIQNRRGAYTDFDPTKMLPGEYAVVLSGDPANEDGYAVYMCYASGVVRRLVSADDLDDVLSTFELSWNNVTDKPSAYPTTWANVSEKPALNPGTGTNSVKQGNSTASGQDSFAEGRGIALGQYAHAEGNSSRASGYAAHVENTNNIASGDNSHSEGTSTSAIGLYSHTEGLGTQASHESQHVFGEWNAIDPSSAQSTSRGTYVEIVGNGTPNTRSNARTLDWQGNEVLAGKLTVGAAPTADMDVATKKYVDDGLAEKPDTDALVRNLTAGTTYYNGDLALYEGDIYESLSTQTRYNESTWRKVILSDVVTGINRFLARTYSPTSAYAVGDYCTYNGVVYRCLTAIPTGGETFTPGHWGRLTLFPEVKRLASESLNVIVEPFVPYGTYYSGDLCLYNNVVYKCARDGMTLVSDYFDVSDWETATLSDVVSVALRNICENTYDNGGIQYNVGDYIMRKNVLYRCKTATSGTWDATCWESTDVVSELNALSERMPAYTDPNNDGNIVIS